MTRKTETEKRFEAWCDINGGTPVFNDTTLKCKHHTGGIGETLYFSDEAFDGSHGDVGITFSDEVDFTNMDRNFDEITESHDDTITFESEDMSVSVRYDEEGFERVD